ncbi:MAG: 4Fe-4S binding protein [Alphaproteobacteria bacterium]|jgi:NosR/NirI family nitrous oxide reductase transcriptional regulator|nr:4Fe-4S binding protein [Alphaproteobacteria bacterium]MDP6515119.1 4Fe-4S binding protein [Alphaproteobacteria bacterium]
MKHFLLAMVVLILPLAGPGESPAGGQDRESTTNLARYLDQELLAKVFPEAERFGPVEGEPPAADVHRGDDLIGYVFETHDLVQSVGFSMKPVFIAVGLGLDGMVRGARLLGHSEPIAILGRTEEDFHQYLTQFAGYDMRHGVSVAIVMSGANPEGEKLAQGTTAGSTGDILEVDAVSRATTSSVLFSDAIVRSARIVARTRGFLTPRSTAGRALDVDEFAPADWSAMIADGSIAHLELTHRQVVAAFEALGDAPPPKNARAAKGDETYLDLYAALVTPAGIGANILGKSWHNQYSAARGVGDLMLLIMANGPYSARGRAYEETGVFDRIQLVQGTETIPLRADQHKKLPFVHAKGRPDLTEIALFFFTADVALDPIAPWRLELALVGAGVEPAMASFSLPYTLPERFVIDVPVAATGSDPAAAMSATDGMDWRQVWRGQPVRIGILLATLAVLTVILSLQDTVSRRPRLHRWLRIGFLAWVLVWLGWYAGAQLSIIHLLNLAQSALADFRLDFFLIEPLIFILSAFVLVGLFLWGRAIFCGWLCPFGALQELLNKAARAVRLPQITLPEPLRERLFAVKYLIFIGLLGLTFYSFDLAMAATMVEPFKTAITFRFAAPWPAVLYALILLGLGLFVERFYCRIICPLGAGLAMLGRLRMFDWLRRRAECGNPCIRCESVCPVGAVKSSGAIDLNECFYCLDCQVMYYDVRQCPPLIQRRKQAQARARQTEFETEILR